ncbi:MAG: hypothetical protein J5980_00625 [Muribaculaceae bacterium]|nr:hypothetical protein [Muribaculaceae bacterium]
MISLLVSMAGCMFTGVESTQRVSEKEVQRTMGELERRQPTMTLQPFLDSVPAWQQGKQFFVTDNQLRLVMFTTAPDTVQLAGQLITYDGYDQGSVLDNRDALNLRFRDRDGKTYVYRTGKTIDQFSAKYSVPLLIDMDMVADVDRQLRNKEVWIKTPIWYDLGTEEMQRGRQFIRVRIDAVEPGNKVLPLKVKFTALDSGERAFLWMSDPNATMHNRDFDSLFSLRDLHENYPEISDATWQLIVRGELVEGMNKEECRLSMGAPKRINQLPNQAGLREYWYYDGGKYLFFVDGLLSQFRK